jgi:hypothetical protein
MAREIFKASPPLSGQPTAAADPMNQAGPITGKNRPGPQKPFHIPDEVLYWGKLGKQSSNYAR